MIYSSDATTMPWDKGLWPTLQPLLDTALDLQPEPRAAFLARVRRETPDIAGALEDLLEDHRRMATSGFLATPLDSAPPAATALAGKTIGAYILERPLGMGGMGTVWLGRRSDGRFDGLVAIKLLRLGIFDEAGQARFRREGSLLARLSHPHVARLLDAGVAPDGQPFLVLEYVEGTRIDQFVRHHHLDIPARLRLFLQVADAVAHAHAKLVVHRDLKPSNILVDAAGQVKLLDFGIATMLDDDAAHEPGTLTRAVGRALTPEYAAPEQVTTGELTTATDVYALGVLLYQFLVGRHPTAARAATDADVVRALIDEEPPRPSDIARRLDARDPAAATVLDERGTSRERLTRDCRGDLDVIVGRALKKLPADRYGTVAAMAADVRRHLDDQPVLARPDSLRYRVRKFVARHRLETISATVALLALVIGATVALRQAALSSAERDRALASLRRAYATNDLSAFLLSQARATGQAFSNAEVLAQGEAIVRARHGDSPDLRVHLLLTLAERYEENQQYKDMARVVAEAVDASPHVADGGLRAHATCLSSTALVEAGNTAGALALIDRALAELTTAPNASEYEGACRTLESIAARRAFDSGRSVRAAERAIAVEESRQAGSAKRLQEALEALAAAYDANLRYDAASRTYQRLMSILDAEGRMDTMFSAVLFNNWSAALQNAGLLTAAVEPAARAVRIGNGLVSEGGASLTMLSTYATVLAAIGRDTEAESLFDASLVKARQAGSATRLRQLLTVAATAAIETGDLVRASALLAEARPLATDPLARGLVARADALLAHAAGHHDDARARITEALDAIVAARATKVTHMRALVDVARVMNEQARFADAKPLATLAAEQAREAIGDLQWSSHVGRSLLEVAAAQCGLGDQATARVAVSEALAHLRATTGDSSRATRRAAALQRGLDEPTPRCTTS